MREQLGERMSKLTALAVRNAKPGRHADGGGLYLLVKPTSAKTWVLRVQVDGRRRDIGLGSVDTTSRAAGKKTIDPEIAIPLLQRKILTLGEAREKAAMLRAAAKSGLDPVAERDRERGAVPTFRKAAQEAHAVLKEGLSAKGADTFIKSLENHVYPILGNKRVDQISAADITAALLPIWTSKPDMARKVRQRIAKVLNFAHGKGWRPTEAPSKSVSAGLPRQPKGGNYEAMPYVDVPAFVAKVSADADTNGRLALLFQIYTAARPGEVRGAQWGQIDSARKDWNRPSELMKGVHAEAHTVTLNSPALALLERIKAGRKPKPEDLIFAGQGGVKMSDMTMNKVLRAEKLSYDAHAFRSSFRDWAAELMPEVPDPVAEAALAHVVPDKVVRAYKRTTFLQMRRRLLDAWGEFVSGGSQNVAGQA